MRARLGVFAVIACIVFAACSSGDGSTPVPDDGGPLFDGKPVADFYRANCSSCHGTDRGGGIGPALTPERLTREDAFYFDAIARGRPGTSMPVWRNRGLTDREISALVEYLRHGAVGTDRGSSIASLESNHGCAPGWALGHMSAAQTALARSVTAAMIRLANAPEDVERG